MGKPSILKFTKYTNRRYDFVGHKRAHAVSTFHGVGDLDVDVEGIAVFARLIVLK